jgi:hypothetical protein
MRDRIRELSVASAEKIPEDLELAVQLQIGENAPVNVVIGGSVCQVNVASAPSEGPDVI